MPQLSRDAEIFLARLADHLRPLRSDEREAVLLELRGHFEERQHQGAAMLRAALDDMGAPERLAREFLDATVSAMRSDMTPGRGVLLPAAIANSNLPAAYYRGVPRLNPRGIIQDFRATLAAAGDGLWSPCAFLVAGFTITAFIASLHSVMPDHVAVPSWLILCVRLTIGMLGSAAAYRCIFGQDDTAWQIDLPIVRYSLASAVLTLAVFAPPNIIHGALQMLNPDGRPDPLPYYHQPLLMLLWIAISLVILRLQPWPISLALDQPISSRSSWEGTAGKGAALAIAWLLTVAPPLLLHVTLSFLSVQLSPNAMLSVGLLFSFMDSIVTMVATIAGSILNAMAFRWVVREPIPAPRPFSSTRPTDAQLAETNLRFHRFLAEKKQRDMEAMLVERAPPGA